MSLYKAGWSTNGAGMRATVLDSVDKSDIHGVVKSLFGSEAKDFKAGYLSNLLNNDSKSMLARYAIENGEDFKSRCLYGCVKGISFIIVGNSEYRSKGFTLDKRPLLHTANKKEIWKMREDKVELEIKAKKAQLSALKKERELVSEELNR